MSFKRNRLKQKGLLRRFSIECYGHQETVEEMRAEKTNKFKELKEKRGSREFEEWFLNYSPSPKNEINAKDLNVLKKTEKITKIKTMKTMKTKKTKNTKKQRKTRQKRSKKGKKVFLNH